MNYTNTPDSDLVEYYINGDERAFNAIVSRHGSKMYKQIQCIVKNRSLTDDLFQEAMIKVVLKLRDRQYKETGHLSGWLIRVTNNVVIDYYRRSPDKNWIISTDDENVDILNREEFSEAPFEQTIIDQQNIEDVLMIMKILPENQREILEMRFYQDLTFNEIADLKNISINTALGRMHYAVKNMRKLAAVFKIFM